MAFSFYMLLVKIVMINVNKRVLGNFACTDKMMEKSGVLIFYLWHNYDVALFEFVLKRFLYCYEYMIRRGFDLSR